MYFISTKRRKEERKKGGEKEGGRKKTCSRLSACLFLFVWTRFPFFFFWYSLVFREGGREEGARIEKGRRRREG